MGIKGDAEKRIEGLKEGKSGPTPSPSPRRGPLRA